MKKKARNILKGKLTKSRANSYNSTQYCQTPKCQEKEYQKCHLIPESSQLKSISENGKVSWINPLPANLLFKDAERTWRVDKIASVLTFKGFCNPCDNSIFKIIDKPLDLKKEEMPLLAYRAFSYHYWIERFEAKSSYEFYKVLGKKLKDIPPVRINDLRVAKSREEEIQYELQSDNYIRDNLIDEIEGKTTTFKTKILFLKQKTDFLYSCAVPLTLDIFMNPVKINWETSWEPPKMFFHILNHAETSVLILSWHFKYDKFAQNFISLIEALRPSELQATLFAYFCFNNMGLAVRPSFVKAIPIELDKRIRKEVKNFNTHKKLTNKFNEKILTSNIGEMEIVNSIEF